MDLYVVDVAIHQARDGHEVTILDRKYTSSDPEVQLIDGVRLVRLDAARIQLRTANSVSLATEFFAELVTAINQISFALCAWRWIRASGKDAIVNVHCSVMGATLCVVAGKGLGSRLVYTSHTLRRLSQGKSVAVLASRALENWLVSRVHRVVALNSATKSRIVQDTGIQGTAVAVVPVGVDASKFQDEELSRRDDAPNGRKTVLYLGRIRFEKGAHVLLKAADIIVNSMGHRDVNFVLVGPVAEFRFTVRESPYLRSLLAEVAKSRLDRHVQFTGRLPDGETRTLLKRCHVFVLPSLAEATPTVVLEAMSCGKPVVGSRVGGVPEQIEDGVTGFLVDPADASQLAHRITYLLEHPEVAKRMGLFGRNVAKERFNWAEISRQLTRAYCS